MRHKLRKVLGAFVCIILVLLIVGYVYTHPGRGPKEQVNAKEKAYVEEIEGTTVLHVKGTPYEMGYQHGALLRDEVQASTASFDELFELGKRETGIPVFVFNFLLDVVYRRCAPYIRDVVTPDDKVASETGGILGSLLNGVYVIEHNGLTDRAIATCANPYVY